ncbi:MAG: hypothetical protein K6G22_04050 [Lachnospiraceae bacterium]|nr:hypothetical protein [Lachnospiraceae bacterium]
MLTMICSALFFAVFFKLLHIGLKVGWGMLKIALFFVFFPAIVGSLIFGGLVIIALPLILIAGIAGMAARV